MMTAALMIFFGASSCMTLTIVAGVMVGARRRITAEVDGAIATAGREASQSGGSFVAAFGH